MRPNLAVLRSAVAVMLTETGTIERSAGVVYDPDTGYEDETFTTVYEGPMLVRPRPIDPREVEVGGTTWLVSKYDVTLPVDADARAYDVVTLDAPDDPDLAGARFRLLDVPTDPWAAAKFCPAERSP